MWSRDEFLSRLKAVGAAKYHDKHRFHVRMQQGKLAEDEVRIWILNRFYYQKHLPIKDALVVAKLPTREDRRLWLQRIVDHDGAREGEGGIEAWLKLAEAAGIPRSEVMDDARILPGVRFAVEGYVNFCRLRPWYQAVASSLTELFAPDLVSERIQAFDNYYPWVRPEGLDYFRNRLRQAPRDAEHALCLVMDYAQTRSDQESAIEALEFKCDVLWSMLDAMEQAASLQVVP